MISVYHLDGDRLILTHYCEVGNQPRMQATSFDPKSNEIDFNFLDATNMPIPTPTHAPRGDKNPGPGELRRTGRFTGGKLRLRRRCSFIA